MAYAPETPLVAASSADEVDVLTPAPDSATNFADDPSAREWATQNVLNLLDTVRSDRSEQHAEWGKIARMASLTRDETQAYTGQSDAYLPIYLKARETKVSHLNQGLFPSDMYIDAQADDPQFEPVVPACKVWMMYQLEHAMKLRAELKAWLRSLLDYGIAIGKVYWDKPLSPIKNTRLAKLPTVDSLLLNYGQAPVWTYEGARFKARSPFSWYCWPTSVNSLDEASLVFEDIQVSKQFVDMMGKKGIWKNTDEINRSTNTENLNPEIQARLSEIAGSANAAPDIRIGDLANWTILTECWLNMPVPRKLYQAGEEVDCPVPVKLVFAGGVLIEARRNPFWHQKPPYLMQRLNEVTDSLYSVGMGRSMRSLQGLANDFINQTNDNGIFGLNPIVKYNPNLIVGPLEPFAPGRMYPMTDTAGMEFDRPPVEQLQWGLMLTDKIISYANDMTGAPAVLQGTSGKGGAKTATGSQILQSNVKGELQDLVEDIELRVMMPLLQMVHSLGQQYESAERWLAISGKEKIQFTRDMLLGELAWKWVASSQAMNRQQRAAQSIQFLQAAANPGVLQLLMQQGKILNPEPILRRIWEDGLGQRNFESVIAPMPMMPMMPGAGGGGPPAPGAPPEPRSAVEQAPGGMPGEMAPGEGGEFMNVRQGADQMAAMMGESGGMGEY